MKKAIIHISDLHICLHEDLKGNATKNIEKFWLSTISNVHNDSFIDKFCQVVKSKYSSADEMYLIVTGDVTDASHEKENKEAERILLKIISELNISKERLLLIPGDHDVNRKKCEDAHIEDNKIGGKKQSYEFEEKYYFFKILYKSLTDLEFDCSKVVVNHLKFENEKMIIVGINSNFKIDYEGGAGYLELSKLEDEISELKIPEDYSIIVAFHHNIFSAYENSQIGSWDKVNRKEVLEFFKKKQIKCFLYGNEHTQDSKLEGKSIDDLVISSDSGSFSSKNNPSPTFKIYDIICNSNSLSLKNNCYQYIDNNKINSLGNWALIESNYIAEVEKFDLIIKKESPPVYTPLIETSKVAEYRNGNISVLKNINFDYNEELFKIIKEKKLFHSGHFHWSETSRAHNWIDVTKILNNNHDLTLAKNAVLDLIINNILIKNRDFDFIIGLGIEGNILSTKLAIKYNKPYSFLPYSYRYEDHNESEKELYFENDGKYKTVLIITDVVNDGRTIRKLIHKEGRADKFFKAVDKIYVVSLFYTGDELNKNSSILNLSTEKIHDKKIKGDHDENRIEYYYVLDLKVEKCPYGENYREDCLIMKEPSLGCIHRFYDEKKLLKNK